MNLLEGCVGKNANSERVKNTRIAAVYPNYTCTSGSPREVGEARPV